MSIIIARGVARGVRPVVISAQKALKYFGTNYIHHRAWPQRRRCGTTVAESSHCMHSLIRIEIYISCNLINLLMGDIIKTCLAFFFATSKEPDISDSASSQPQSTD